MGTEDENTGGTAKSNTLELTVRPLEQGDFFAWYELFAGYAEFYNTPLVDERAMRAWAWLHGDKSAVRGLVAVDASGAVLGLAHVQEFERLLENDRGLLLEDLFVAPQHRGKGVATAVINHLKDEARDRGFGVIRWITAEDNETARRLYDSVAEKTDWVTYEFKLG
ncbi:GNAT family N-acetyltransferase [Naasia aerilata]|nr:GNAT family N-acetyltransferase [Naasia aerilata]